MFDNWEVHCYDSHLQPMWEKVLLEDVHNREDYSMKSMGILIAPNRLEKGDEGVVVVGGAFQATLANK